MSAMEFHETLQQLRKEKGLTQEELAQALYVSRTAVSKWESGRGYPNIESLKAMAVFFQVSIDRLLTGTQALDLAQQEHQQKRDRFRNLALGLTDLSALLLVVLPMFRQPTAELVYAVSLAVWTGTAYLAVAYWTVVAAMAAMGALTLALYRCRNLRWNRINYPVSVLLHALATALFILSSQPYPAVFLFALLVSKLLLTGKRL